MAAFTREPNPWVPEIPRRRGVVLRRSRTAFRTLFPVSSPVNMARGTSTDPGERSLRGRP